VKSPTAILIVVAAGLALGAGIYFAGSTPKAAQSADAPGPLVPSLDSRLNDAAVLELRSPTQSLRIAREGEQWVLSNQGGFPADLAKVRGLLLGVGELERIERKTANATRFGELGLDLHAAEDSAQGNGTQERIGTRLAARTSDGTVLFDVVLGRSAAGARFDRPERYARLADSGPAWLVRGRADVDVTPATWFSKDVPTLARADARAVTIEHPGGERVSVHGDGGTWTLSDIPEGRELAWPQAAGSLAGLLESLTFEDAKPRAELDGLAGPEAVVTTVHAANGLQLVARTLERDGVVWLTVDAAVVAPAPSAAPQPTESEGSEMVDVVAVDETVSADAAPLEPAPFDPAPAAAEAERWNAIFSRFAVAIPSWNAGNLRKRTQELLKPLPSAGPPGPGDGVEEGVAPEGLPPGFVLPPEWSEMAGDREQ